MLELMYKSIDSDFFTKGQVYFSFDGSLETGVVVSDDDNKPHHLSSDFIKENFEVVSGYYYGQEESYE